MERKGKTYKSTAAIQTLLQDETIVWPTDGVQKGYRRPSSLCKARERRKGPFPLSQGHPIHYKGSGAKTNIIFECFIIFFSGKRGLKQHVSVLDAVEPAAATHCTVARCQRFKARQQSDRSARPKGQPISVNHNPLSSPLLHSSHLLFLSLFHSEYWVAYEKHTGGWPSLAGG